MIMSKQVQTTTYFDFIKSVELERSNRFSFPIRRSPIPKEEDGKLHLFKTGVVDNPQLPQILQEKGIDYTAEIPETPNLFLSVLVRYGLPILFFSMIGRQVNKTMIAG